MLDDGKLRIDENVSYRVALFSLPKERKIRCQCLRTVRMCNKPIYSKIVFVTDGKDYCVLGYTCATELIKRQGVSRGKALRSVPELDEGEMVALRDKILRNISEVVPYLNALRDKNEAALIAEEKRLGAKRLPLDDSDLQTLKLRTGDTLERGGSLRRAEEIARQSKIVREQKQATAQSLVIRMQNWFHIRISASDVLAYADGRKELPPKVVDQINSIEEFAALRRVL